MRQVWTLPLLFACASLCACDDLDEFHTGPDEVFYGSVVGSEPGDESPSFIRRGFETGTQLELTFDPKIAETYTGLEGEDPTDPPGTIDTYTCPPDENACAEADRTPGHFDHAPLVPIAGLAHDALSQYDFPGGGRLKNFLFEVRFVTDDPAGAIRRHAMVFVSLMNDGHVEMRVIAPNVLDDDGETELYPALFGVFRLHKHAL